MFSASFRHVVHNDHHNPDVYIAGMDHLAPELWHDIWSLACTDGGFTGCSLSLVSQDIRAASRPARFNSVAISGTSKQLAGFLYSFNKERAIAEVAANGYRPVVKHLFFAAVRGRLEHSSAGDAGLQEATLLAQYRQDVAALFRLVSRDLQTLCFVYCSGWNEVPHLGPQIDLPEGFPALRKLHVHGRIPLLVVGAGDSPVNFPQLTHLRLPFATYGTEGRLTSWAHRAPNVTHLCVSRVSGVSSMLEDISAGGGPFKNLSKLYLEPQSPPPPGGRCGNPRIEYGRFMYNFENLIAAAMLPTKALTPLEHGVSAENAAIEEWLDRIGGGAGCWSPIEPRPADWVPAKRHTIFL